MSMWSKGIEYKKRETEKLSKISSKDLPFDVFVKNDVITILH